jgi:hypothetical protein
MAESMRKFRTDAIARSIHNLRPEPLEGQSRHPHVSPRASHEPLSGEQRERLRKQALILRLIEYFSRYVRLCPRRPEQI